MEVAVKLLKIDPSVLGEHPNFVMSMNTYACFCG